jgi:hypothetical protein
MDGGNDRDGGAVKSNPTMRLAPLFCFRPLRRFLRLGFPACSRVTQCYNSTGQHDQAPLGIDCWIAAFIALVKAQHIYCY